MPDTPTASIVIPTRRRSAYLEVALRSIAPQARALGAELIVVDDGNDRATREVARRQGATLVAAAPPGGVNAARNAGIEAAAASLIVLTDDDVRAPDGWLAAILEGAERHPEHDVFGGPIVGVLEGGPRGCGREPAPITTLDLGPADCDAELVWGANMAIRRRALERVGLFDATLSGRGDEEEWQRRHTAAGARTRYLARATIQHRRSREDSRLVALTRAAYRQGREARRHDVRSGKARPPSTELRTLAGCAWHTLRHRCAFGIVMGARAAGSLREIAAAQARRPPDRALASESSAPPLDFLSGESGQVSGMRATVRAVVADAAVDLARLVAAEPLRLRRAARAQPPRRVLTLAVERADRPNLLAAARAELLRSRHEVTFESCEAGDRGKFENLNLLLERSDPSGHDWLVVLDDDVRLPRGFLDVFLALAERFDLALAAPAHRARSHAAWRVTRRRAASLVRETAWVEIGPVVALHRRTFEVLLPFPPLRAGWGLDAHWGALAREHGWRCGVVDATAITHGLRPIASAYDHAAAVAESRAFLRDRAHITAGEARRTLATHRRLT
ncbi:MAG TPA: glycosyltransferase [Solirubrobacteraceae bacterium]|nr:glycosyltransferase [Solirubrobacteraceae bacterium]